MDRWRDGSIESQYSPQSVVTFVDTVAEGTLVAPATVDELHVGTHVGLAAVASDRARLAMVDYIKRCLDTYTHTHTHTHTKQYMHK